MLSSEIIFNIDKFLSDNIGEGKKEEEDSKRNVLEESDLRQEIRVQCDKDGFVLDQKCRILQSIKCSIPRLESSQWPEVIKEDFIVFFQRTVNRIINNRLPKSIYDRKNPKLLKLESICKLNTIPINPFVIDTDRLPVKFILKIPFKDVLRALNLIIFKLKGISPIFKTHTNITDTISLQDFNKEGWENAFMEMAELLKNTKRIKGVCGTAWFVDPNLINISPEISFVNEILNEVGAIIFKQDTNQDCIKDAIFFNSKRKSLYKEGKYLPKNYLFIITRDQLIEWSMNR